MYRVAMSRSLPSIALRRGKGGGQRDREVDTGDAGVEEGDVMGGVRLI